MSMVITCMIVRAQSGANSGIAGIATKYSPDQRDDDAARAIDRRAGGIERRDGLPAPEPGQPQAGLRQQAPSGEAGGGEPVSGDRGQRDQQIGQRQQRQIGQGHSLRKQRRQPDQFQAAQHGAEPQPAMQQGFNPELKQNGDPAAFGTEPVIAALQQAIEIGQDQFHRHRIAPRSTRNQS
jgi:hypothetical protein